MAIQATSNVNFTGKYYDAGACTTVSKKAVNLVKREGTEAIAALQQFRAENVQKDISHPGNWFQSLIRQFRSPRHASTEMIDIGVRKGAQSASGQDTLILSHSRNHSGLTIPGATIEVGMPYPPTKEAVLGVLREAKAKASLATERNYQAEVLRYPGTEIVG